MAKKKTERVLYVELKKMGRIISTPFDIEYVNALIAEGYCQGRCTYVELPIFEKEMTK